MSFQFQNSYLNRLKGIRATLETSPFFKCHEVKTRVQIDLLEDANGLISACPRRKEKSEAVNFYNFEFILNIHIFILLFI